jgi:acetylornithine deacetylase
MVFSEMEKTILHAIDRRDIIDLESDLISIPSFTTEEQELARFIYGYMKSMGLNAELEEVPLKGVRTDIDVRFDSSYIPIGKIEGSGKGPSLLFFGHMDTGPDAGRSYWDPSKTWKRNPFKPIVEEPFIYGKGSSDEKGGICAFLIAAKAMLKAGFKPKGDIYFCPVPGHKSASWGTLHLLHKYRLRTDYAVKSEGTGMWIVPIFVGRSEGSIHIRAPPVHPSQKLRWPELRGRKSVFEQTYRLMQALGPEMMPPGSDSWMTFEVMKELELFPQFRYEVLKLHQPPAARGGSALPSHIELGFQVRTVPGQTAETIKADLKRLVKKLQMEDPHFEAEIDWPRWPTRPAVNTPYDSPLVKTFASAHKDLIDDPPLDVSAKGRLGSAADGSHTFGVGIPTILLGPGGGPRDVYLEEKYPRTDKDERILIDDIVNCANVFAISATRLCG